MTTPETSSTAIRAAADALRQARASGNAIPPLREWLRADALGDAYEVQAHNVARRVFEGGRRIGRKIGLTSVAVQKQLGVDQPDFGVLFDDMLYRGRQTAVGTSGLIQPKIEGEIAFIVAQDVTEAGMARKALARHAGDAVAAFEIVDSAIADWKISLADTVADNASCGAVVIGKQRKPLAGLETARDIRLAGMVMTEDDRIVSLGVGAASLGDPMAAFAWLADKAIELGDPLRAGEIVLTGALGPMVPFLKGRRYRLEIAGFEPLEVLAE